MARRTSNRLQATRIDKAEKAPNKAEGAVKVKSKKATKPARSTRVKKKSGSKVVRLRVRWAVFNDNMKRVAVFDYPHRGEADRKAADLIDKGKGHHFVHAIKEPMPEAEAAEAK